MHGMVCYTTQMSGNPLPFEKGKLFNSQQQTLMIKLLELGEHSLPSVFLNYSPKNILKQNNPT